MDYSFLSPVQDRLVDELELQTQSTIGKKLRFIQLQLSQI